MSAAARRLIVNADDFGRTPGVNRGILRAHLEGLVTSATLMVAHAAAEDAAALARTHPSLGVGLHVALTGGPPVLDPARVPSLVDSQGRLPAKLEGLARATPADVRAEVRTQLERCESLLGRAPTHLDSHHHAHRLPVVFEALVELAHEHHLPVRCAAPGMGARLHAHGVATSDWFREDFFGADARLDVLLALLRNLPAGLTELMCHPAEVDEGLRAGSSYVAERERELACLIDPRVQRVLAEESIQRVHFGVLAG